MISSMATANITITLQEEQIKEIHSLIATGGANSVSGFIQHAVAIAIHDAAGWHELLKEALDETGGPLTKKERAWADEILGAK